MYSFAIIGAESALANIKAQQKEHELFEKYLSTLPPDEAENIREKRRLEKREERIHADLCNAIKYNNQSKSNGIGMSDIIIGGVIAEAIMSDDCD